MPLVPFITQTYQSRSKDVSDCRTLNMYPERVPSPEGKSQNILIGTPGTSVFCDVSEAGDNAACRSLYYTSTSRLFAVYGRFVYEIFSNGSKTQRFEVSLGGSRCYMADDGQYLVVVDGSVLRYYNLNTNTVMAVTLPDDLTQPTQVIFTNYRFVVINGKSNKFWFSDFEDRTLWPGLNIYNAESSADYVTAIATVGGNIWAFGPRSYEIWVPQTSADSPWAKVGGSSTEVGIGAVDSIATIAGTCFWIGSSTVGSGQVFASTGSGHQRISDHSIEYMLSQMGTISDCIGFTYQMEGHVFLVLTFINGDKTLVYDLTTNQWHERSTRDPNLNIQHRWDPTYAVFAFGKVFTGALRTPKLLELSLDVYKEWDDRAITRLHQSPVYWTDLRNVRFDEFVVDLETGVGLQNGQGSNPQIMMQYSKDGGHTWSSEDWKTLGAIGQYQTRCAWRRMGMSREMVFRVVVTDPVKVVMINARVITSAGVNR